MKTELVANNQNVEGNEHVLDDVVSDADDLLRKISGATAESLALARTKIEEKMSEAKSNVEAARNSISGKVHDAADNVYGYVAENPWKVAVVATAAAVAGVIVGVFLNRR